jgi:YbgC/YbaW family acyl-CoA thioester hydrolase
MTPSSAHRTSITVRGYELDSYGHVNNAVYIQYLEQGRWQFLKDNGLLDPITERLLLLVVVETKIRYVRESNLFDELEIETGYRIEGPFIVFEQKIRNRKTGLQVSRATVRTVFVDQQKTPQDVPEFMRLPVP